MKIYVQTLSCFLQFRACLQIDIAAQLTIHDFIVPWILTFINEKFPTLKLKLNGKIT